MEENYLIFALILLANKRCWGMFKEDGEWGYFDIDSSEEVVVVSWCMCIYEKVYAGW